MWHTVVYIYSVLYNVCTCVYYDFFCGFTCASLPFNLNPISLHIAQIPDGCQRHRRKSTDGFFWKTMKWPFWNLALSQNGVHIWLVDHCVLSLSPSPSDLFLSHRFTFTWLMSFHDRHLSFIPWPPFYLCVSDQVCYYRELAFPPVPFGKCTMRATATI